MIYEFNSDERKLRKARMERQNELTIATIQKLAKDEGLKEGKQEGIQEGIELGKQEGIELGEQKGILLVAKNMKELNISLEDISKATGLSIEVIKEL